jgi:AAA+ superfamily predicted ATPase
LPKEKTDSFNENNTMSTGNSFNPQHEISDRVRSKFVIDGEWKAPSDSAKLDLISPNTEELFLRVPAAYPELQG